MSETNPVPFPDPENNFIPEPIVLFQEWLAHARAVEPNDPNAACLATVDSQGFPAARMVLVKQIDERGFAFYTNLHSAKGQDLEENPRAALCFYWKSFRHQVRIRGPVIRLDEEEADDYFASRPRGHQMGAWASRQSKIMEDSTALERSYAAYEDKFTAQESISRPPYWSGYRICPLRIEFWRDRKSRLHDRIVYTSPQDEHGWPATGEVWHAERLYP